MKMLEIIGGLAAAIAVILVFRKVILWCIDRIRLHNYNKNVCDVVTKLRNDFFQETYHINTEENLKPFKIEKTKNNKESVQPLEDYTLFLFPSYYFRNSRKNLNLYALNIVIDWNMKKPLKDKLRMKGISEEEADEIAKEETKEFIEKKIKGKLLKKNSSIETLKTRITLKAPSSPIRSFIRKNSPAIRKHIRNNYHKKDFTEKYNNFTHKNKEYKQIIKDDPISIIRSIQLQKKIKDDLGVESDKSLSRNKKIEFTRATKRSLYELKKSFLTNKKEFIKRVNLISNRSEEIFALILVNPGLFEMQMNSEFGIPQPTISIYAKQMEKDDFVIKDNFTTKGNYVFLYPKFTKEDIANHSALIRNYEIVFIGKLIKIKNKYCLDEIGETMPLKFDSKRIDLQHQLGRTLLIRGSLEKNGVMNITAFGIVLDKYKQEDLGKFF